MNLRKLGTALVVVLALGAMTASTALAAAVTEDTKWTWNGSVLPEGSANAKSVTGSLLTGTTAVLDTEVGETHLKLKATGLECLECKIENPTGATSGTGTGKLKFTTVTAVEPAACVVSTGTVTTNLLTVDPDFMIGERNFAQFKPVSGTAFATVKLEKCPISGSYIVAGTAFVETANKTGVTSTTQDVKTNATINSEAGGALTFGSKAATLSAEGSFSAALPFGTEKKP